jgi:hypothetical protein
MWVKDGQSEENEVTDINELLACRPFTAPSNLAIVYSMVRAITETRRKQAKVSDVP